MSYALFIDISCFMWHGKDKNKKLEKTGYWYEVIETYWFNFKGVWLFPFGKPPQNSMLIITCSVKKRSLL